MGSPKASQSVPHRRRFGLHHGNRAFRTTALLCVSREDKDYLNRVDMRRAVLLRSVQRVLGDDSEVRDAAYVWSRHRWITPFATLVFVAIVLLAPVAGVEEWPTRLVIGLAGLGVAFLATTDYRVVAETDTGIVVLKASRIRQVATEFGESLARDADLRPVGGTVLATDWLVGDHRYTVPRSSEQAMERMAEGRPSRH